MPNTQNLKMHWPTMRSFVDRMGVNRDTCTWFLMNYQTNKIFQRSGCATETIETIRRLHDDEHYRVSVMLHHMKGNGYRKESDIMRWDTVSLDLDRELPSNWRGGFIPAVIVRTSQGHYQPHWRLHECVEPRRGFDVTLGWSRAHGGDGGALQITQPFLVPGTYNWKYVNKPPLVSIVEGGTDELTSIEAFEAELSTIEAPKPKTTGHAAPSSSTVVAYDNEERFRALVEFTNLTFVDRKQWGSAGKAFWTVSSGASWAFEYWLTICQRSPDYQGRADCEREWRQFNKGKSIGGDYLWDLAKKSGFNLSANGREYPSGSQPSNWDLRKATRLDEPKINEGKDYPVPNACYGSKLWVGLSLPAREVLDVFRCVFRPWTNDGYAMSLKFIAEHSGLMRATVRKAVRELIRSGIIVEHKAPTKTSYGLYTLCEMGTRYDSKTKKCQTPKTLVWAAQPRVDTAVRTNRNLIAALNRGGCHVAPCSRLLTKKYRQLSRHAREVNRLACSMHNRGRGRVQGNNGSIELSVEFVAVQTGLRPGDVLNAICELRNAELISARLGHQGANASIVTVHEYGTKWDAASSKYLLKARTDWTKIYNEERRHAPCAKLEEQLCSKLKVPHVQNRKLRRDFAWSNLKESSDTSRRERT